MSQQDVDTIRTAYDAFARGDMDGVMAALADDVDWDSPATLPWGGRFRGKEEVGRFFAGLFAHLEELNAEPQEFLDAGDHVVVLGRHRGRLKGGSDFEAAWAMVWRMRDGKAETFREMVDTAAIVASRERQTA